MQRMMVLVELPEATAPAAGPCPPPHPEDGDGGDRRCGRERRGTFSLDTAPPPNGEWEARPYVFRAFRDRRGAVTAAGAPPASRAATDREPAAGSAGAGVHVVAAYGGSRSGADEPALPAGWIDLHF